MISFFRRLLSPPAPAPANVIQSTGRISDKAELHLSKIYGDVSIEDHAKLNEVYINGKVRVGKNTSLWGPNIDIYSLHNEVRIGNFCSVARNTSIQEYNHIYDRCSSYFIFQNVLKEPGGIMKDTVSLGPVTIGHDVWIGAHCVILSGVTIGDGAVIGANSVVSSDIPAFAIAVGSPAKVVKYRFEPPVIEQLQKIQWWNWPHERIQRNRELFEGPLTLEKLYAIRD